MKITRTVPALLAMGLAFPAFAQEMPPPPVPEAPPVPDTISLDRNEEIFWQSESALVKQLRLLELHAQIAETQRKIDGVGMDGPMDAVNRHPPLAPPLIRPGSGDLELINLAPSREKRTSSEPVDVIGIWGLEGDHTADVLNNGMRVSVREGDALPDGWKVESIRRTGMAISKGKERKTLTVAATLGD